MQPVQPLAKGGVQVPAQHGGHAVVGQQLRQTGGIAGGGWWGDEQEAPCARAIAL
jgi:hypothetical protein